MSSFTEPPWPRLPRSSRRWIFAIALVPIGALLWLLGLSIRLDADKSTLGEIGLALLWIGPIVAALGLIRFFMLLVKRMRP